MVSMLTCDTMPILLLQFFLLRKGFRGSNATHRYGNVNGDAISNGTGNYGNVTGSYGNYCDVTGSYCTNSDVTSINISHINGTGVNVYPW